MPVDIRIRFGRAVRRIREEQEINQEEAADRCGLHRTYYSGIERGVRNVSLVNIEKVAKGLKPACPICFAECDSMSPISIIDGKVSAVDKAGASAEEDRYRAEEADKHLRAG